MCDVIGRRGKVTFEETEKILTSSKASEAIAKSTCGQVAADHKTSADASAKEFKALAEDNANCPC